MGKWRWQGFDKNGKRIVGQVDATNEREARRLLLLQGLKIKKLTPPSLLELDLGEWLVNKGLARPFKASELALFTRQLSTMLDAGIPIVQSLEILYQTQKAPSLKTSIRKVANALKEGDTISKALLEQKGFSKLYCNLVGAGETGGTLDQILNKLSVYLEKQEKIKSKIKSAMLYPGIVSLLGIGVVSGMMLFIVPIFVDILSDTGKRIPLITQIVIGISNFLKEWLLIIGPGFFAFLIFIKYYTGTPKGKEVFDRFTMNMPIWGQVIIKGNLSSFASTLSILLNAGISLIDALDICAETIDNSVISKDLKKVRQSVTWGKTLTEPLSQITYFPQMVSQMVKVGEQTGGLNDMLVKVSSVLEEQVENAMDAMGKMIEPLVIVVLGGIIAVIITAMYLPIFMAAGG